MKTLHVVLFRILPALFIALALVFPGASGVKAQVSDPQCGSGSTCSTDSADPGMDAQSATLFKQAYKVTLKGGYVAHGIGMRNRGFGSIYVGDVPAGSTIKKAYLFWAVIGPSNLPGVYYWKGLFNGAAISGALVGSALDPYWTAYNPNTLAAYPQSQTPIWSYRADVTSKIIKGGNGTYNLSGFASGVSTGVDPFLSPGVSANIAPLIEGASLVIVYANANRPMTTFQIYNGAATTVYNELHLNMPGLNAVAPTGFAYTTFIGADGQSNGDVGSKFFTTTLPTVGWDGGDPNGNEKPYSQGNLWDTMTVDIHSLVNPPEPDFWVTAQGAELGSFEFSDVLTWVAQVVSYASGNQDTDGDRLKDGWELNGYDSNGDGFIDVPIDIWGANPLHKDLFVQADYMYLAGSVSLTQLPPVAQLNDIVQIFADANVSNPDAITGVNIHIDTGGADYDHAAGTYPEYNLGGWGGLVAYSEHLGADTSGCNTYDWAPFQALKDAHFPVARSPIFHYMIFAHDLAPCFGSVSGISRNGGTDALFIKGATDFIVSMGSWGSGGTATEREGTFIHELGHNLGLRHGGNDHANYKPNYLSVMNYSFQTWGVYRSGTWGNYDYSRVLLPTINENALSEAAGLGPLAAGYGTRWWCPSGVRTSTAPVDTNVDWNCSGGINAGTVSVDTNGYGKASLGSQNNWASITFFGAGVIGSGMSPAGIAAQALPTTRWTQELTFEENQVINGSIQVP